MPYADLSNPQSFNRYAYLNDNPLGGIDADGHCGAGDPPGLTNEGGTMLNEVPKSCQSLQPPEPKAPIPPPMAVLHTSIKGGYTQFEWTDKKGGFHDDKIRSLVKVDRRSKPGAVAPFQSNVVGQIKRLSSPAYGPEGAQINTGDSRGRWIHGGGSSLADPYAPNQALMPTFGCTRACNAFVLA